MGIYFRLIFLLMFLGCSSTESYQLSDHFNGSHFYNPTLKEGNGAWDTLKLLITIRFKKWPEKVMNEARILSPLVLKDDQVAVTFINHATVLIQTKDFNILTDPVWSERVSPLSWAGPKRVREAGIPINLLPPIDLVLISHNHYDHLDLESLTEINKRFQPRFLVPLGDRELLQAAGLKNIEEMDWWQQIEISPYLQVTFAPTQHMSGRGIFDWNESLWGSFMIHTQNKKIYFGGDAAYSSHYQEIRKRLGEADLSFIPIGAYEPRWFMKAVHMNPEDAVKAHLDLGSKQSVGIHFGTFQLTEEGIDQPAKDLEKAILQGGIQPERFYLLKEGATRILNLSSL